MSLGSEAVDLEQGESQSGHEKPERGGDQQPEQHPAQRLRLDDGIVGEMPNCPMWGYLCSVHVRLLSPPKAKNSVVNP